MAWWCGNAFLMVRAGLRESCTEAGGSREGRPQTDKLKTYHIPYDGSRRQDSAPATSVATTELLREEGDVLFSFANPYEVYPDVAGGRTLSDSLKIFFTHTHTHTLSSLRKK